MAQTLHGMQVAVLAADGFEQVELTRPARALQQQGAEVTVVSPRPGSIRGMNLLVPGKKVHVDRTLLRARADDYDALFIPGGYVNPDILRQSDRALNFVREFERAGKPIAVICHAPWVLISADLVRGRRLTSWPGIRDDVVNAGGTWVDEAVVQHHNWLSSRGPQDLAHFDRAIVRHFARYAAGVTPAARFALEEDTEQEEGGWARWLLGGLAAAALGYASRDAVRGAMHTDDADGADGEYEDEDEYDDEYEEDDSDDDADASVPVGRRRGQGGDSAVPSPS